MKIYNLAFLLVFLFSFNADQVLQFPQSCPLPTSQQKQKTEKVGVGKINNAGAENIIFKSADGGQTWQDISEGLPENLQAEDFQRDGFFANESGVYLSAGNEIYHSSSNSTAPFWKKEIFPGTQSSIAPGNNRSFAYNWNGHFLQKINGTNVWSTMYTNFQIKGIRTVFETARGTVFIGCQTGFYKSTNSGKTWETVHAEGWVMKLVESNGILMATSQSGILMSTDEGESWDCVLSEGGVGIDVESIKGGFAAITYNTQSETRRVRASYDGGKTWQAIDAGLKGDQRTASIIQVGGDFFCGHPDGIYRSSDKGKTWKLLLPSLGERVFNLFVSGNVIYAIPRSGGC
jgi:photosystem II stability/assembly factor-like uncharacterized protein